MIKLYYGAILFTKNEYQEWIMVGFQAGGASETVKPKTLLQTSLEEAFYKGM